MAAIYTKKSSEWGLMAEVGVAVVVVYFLLGGYAWSPAIWAVFTVVAIWIVIKNMRREAGLESEDSYDRWRLKCGFLIVVSLLASPLWLDSWWPFLVGLVLAPSWLNDYRYLRELRRKRQVVSREG